MSGPPDERFFQKVRAARARALLLDYDGTLAPFRVQREKAVPYAGVRQALAEIMMTGGTRLVVISGRACDEVRSLLRLDPSPEIWGSHGWERRSAEGVYLSFPLPDAAKKGLAAALHLAEEDRLMERTERKPASLALHWRGRSPAEARSLAAWGRQRWVPLAQAHGLELREFDGGLELRVPERHKGTVVRAILAETPPRALVAYLGDDLTDEDAFRSLPRSGLGVLVRRRYRPTAARAWIRPPKELLGFLKRWKAATASGAG